MSIHSISISKVLLILLILSLFIFLGCNESSNGSITQTENRGTPECPVCGQWESPKGSRRIKSAIAISPSKFEMRLWSIKGTTCTVAADKWEADGGRKGVILLKDPSMECSNGKKLKTQKHRLNYCLGDYTLLIGEDENTKALFIRSGVEIPERHNPLIAKWGALNPGEKPEQYKGKWETILFRIWFRKNSMIFNYQTTYLEKYIVENDKVIVIHKSGKWSIVYLAGDGTVLLKKDFLHKMGSKNEELAFTRIE